MKKLNLFFLLLSVLLVNAQSPLSKFTAATTGANSVTFTNESTGSPTSFTWEFTGGTPSSSTSPNPSVAYAAAGIYTATLTVNNASGSSVSTRTVKVSTGEIIDLSTGRNDDGTLMPIGTTDYDWKCELPNGTIVNPFTRSTYGQWSFAQIIGNVKNSVWITGNDIGTGNYIYRSKSFTIPENVLHAKLNLRTLSFVTGWTYLMKENTDGTQTETLITQNTGTGWFNSGNALVSNLPLNPGKYHIKVKVYDNNSSVTEAMDTNVNINFGYGFAFSPIAEFSATPASTNVGSSVQFSNLSQGNPTSVSWNFEDGANVLTSTQNNPSVAFSTVGNHYAQLSADYGSGLLSSLRINDYIQTTQVGTPVVSSTQPSCSVSTGSITVTSPATGVTYSFDNGVSFQTSNTLSGLAAGTYVIKVKNLAGSVSGATNVIINQALGIPANPVLNIVQPSCSTTTGSITATSPSTDVQYSFDGGITYQASNAKAGITPGTYTVVVKNSSGCTSTAIATIVAPDCRDWTKAPNSYIYTGKDANNNEVDGIYIPVKKAYAMWNDQNGLVNDPTILNGTPTAEVYWEDVAGLIRSSNYILPIENSPGGSAADAKIKVEIDRAKGEGNAVVALKINGKIIWSWHVWVTDDPTAGVTYGNVRAGAETASYIENGITKKFTPKWMDRNLGATNKSFIGYDWNKSGGLMYQWGRKDPFPALENKDASMYEISGTVGVIKHLYDYTADGAINKLDGVQRQFPDINSNIKYAVNNPLKLIFTNVVSGDAWFAQSIGTDNISRKKADLWGDNSQNASDTSGSTVNTYKPKTAYDPCPNNWRIPSYINNTFATTVTNTFSPWGRDGGSPANDLASFVDVKPTTENGALKGIKIYANLGMDFTNTSIGSFSRNMGVYPGNGKYVVGSTGDFYHQDPHEIIIQSATVAHSAPYSYFFYALADAGQSSSKPDSSLYPNMVGKYYVYSYESTSSLTGGSACRCIEDKYAVSYNFPTEYLNSGSLTNFTEGINQPNSYIVTKSQAEQEIQIPIAKAFSVYNQYLSDHGMLDFSNLKVNVHWTDNKSLISNVKIMNLPTNVNNIKDGYISVKVPGNQSGNALVSLHNNNVSNPAYWSWHVWVNNSNIGEVVYQTEDVLLPATSNYVNFTNSGAQPMKSTFMDRNLGATDAFPNVVSPEAVTAAELAMINNSAGMQYQWGRKDPIPSFIKTGLNTASGLEKIGDYSIWTSSGPDANGNIYASSFTELNGNNYVNNYTKRRGVDYGTVGAYKKEKIQNNLKYSVENPLAFMMPNEKYTNKSSFNAAYGQDWLFSTPNQMMERWGHATVKSPFDPCPGGWRVPDISITVPDNEPGDINHTNDNKGSSPWYNGFFKPNASVDKFKIHTLGIVQGVGFEIKKPSDIYNGGVPYYLGAIVKNSNLVYGYQFNGDSNSGNTNTQYKIGNYPATGFRGFSSNNSLSSSMNLGISGVWTGALKSANSYGTAYNIAFETVNASLSRLIAMNEFEINHPMNAMNVRCVKEEPRFGQLLGTATNMGSGTTNTSNKKDTRNNVFDEQKEDIEVYPNPVKNLLYIKPNTIMMYEIYDTGGRLVSKGETLNSRIDCSALIKGLYVLKLHGTKETITKKIVKE